MTSSSSSAEAVPVRAARLDELGELGALALRSKAHWGYDQAFIDACRAELTIAPERLGRQVIRVAEVAGRAGGYYALEAGSAGEGELLDLFVDDDLIGRGVGRALWDDLLAEAAARGVARLRIEADPHAEAWYLRRGARRVGDVASGSIPGRRLPLLVLDVAGPAQRFEFQSVPTRGSRSPS